MATSTLYQSSSLGSTARGSTFCTFSSPRQLFQPKADWRASFANSNKESVRNIQSKPLILRHQNGTWFPKLNNDNPVNNLQHQTEVQSSQSNQSPSETRLSLGRVPKTLRCHVCHVIIREEYFQAHLFFGNVRCDLCDLVCNNCRDFQQAKRNSDKEGSCQHIFVYVDDPCEYLLPRLSGSDDMDTGGSMTLPNKLRILQNYVNQLTSLHLQEPWCNAVRKCKSTLIKAHRGTSMEILQNAEPQEDLHNTDRGTLSDNSSDSYDSNDENSGNNSNSELLRGLLEYEQQDLREKQGKDEGVLLTQNYDLEHLEKEVEYVELEEQVRLGIAKADANHMKNKKRRKFDNYKRLKAHRLQSSVRRKRHQSTLTSTDEISEESLVKEDVALPEDGYYLMVREPVEECPMCYECLSPNNCSVNLRTFLFTVSCTECGLLIYIVPELPDGLQIVTDNNGSGGGSPESIKQSKTRRVTPRDFFAK